MKPVPISEIFGPVIQGEGAQAGVPTIFIRTGGCDYRCSWCDTLYAVDPVNSPNWTRMGAAEIVAAVLALAGDTRPLITLSGGNPAMWKLGELVDELHGHGFTVTIETQGSVWAEWAPSLDSITISPKPPSSGEVTNWPALDRWIAAKPDHVAVKVVIDSPADLDFAGLVRDRLAPGTRIHLQPCNPYVDESGEADPDKLELLARYAALCDAVLARGWMNATVIPQLHVLAKGGGRGN